MGSDRGGAGALAVSFIVDEDPIFAYSGWHLAHSLVQHCPVSWSQIHVQCTPAVPARTVEVFRQLGCTTHRLERFGDGKYCNKIGQWENLRGGSADHYLFLDTDMICVGDFSASLPMGRVAGKVVDLPNPRIELLDDVFARAGFRDRPPLVDVDSSDDQTYRGNCNGGVYSVPAEHGDRLFDSWKRHALALLAQIEPLRAAGKASHVDQVAFCMAIHETALPFEQLPSNLNYPLHLEGPHKFRDRGQPLMLLHYHNASLNVLGLMDAGRPLDGGEAKAVSLANAQILAAFDTHLFWDFRYRHFPERGSGVGSRGANLQYKRALLRGQGAERASSILDVGCGDLEVVRALDLKNYVGIDLSPASLRIASAARPDWTFLQAPAPDAPEAEMVLCFEVAIHQPSMEEYRSLIEFLAAKTQRTLIVSGYDQLTDRISANHMLHYYEPLPESLRATGRFSSVERIGSHSDVVVYRCDVG